MTTATEETTDTRTDPVTDARWDDAIYRLRRYTDQTMALVPNKRYERINSGLEEIAVLLTGDGLWEEELADFGRLTLRIWDTIETEFKAWGSATDARRAAIRRVWEHERELKAKEASAAS